MEFQYESRIEAPRDELFAFHEDPGNLAVLMQGRRDFRLLRHDDNIRPGSEVWVEMKFGPLAVTLGFREFLYEPPERFGERLIRGPFSRFTHVHDFAADGDATLLTDQFEIELPLKLGGTATLKRLVLPRMDDLCEYRRRTFNRMAREGYFEQHGR